MSRVGATVKLRSFETISSVALTSSRTTHRTNAQSQSCRQLSRSSGKSPWQSCRPLHPSDGGRAAMEDCFVGWLVAASQCRRRTGNSITKSCTVSSVQRRTVHITHRRPVSTKVQSRSIAAAAIDEHRSDHSNTASFRRNNGKERDVDIAVDRAHGSHTKNSDLDRYTAVDDAIASEPSRAQRDGIGVSSKLNARAGSDGFESRPATDSDEATFQRMFESHQRSIPQRKTEASKPIWLSQESSIEAELSEPRLATDSDETAFQRMIESRQQSLRQRKAEAPKHAWISPKSSIEADLRQQYPGEQPEDVSMSRFELDAAAAPSDEAVSTHSNTTGSLMEQGDPSSTLTYRPAARATPPIKPRIRRTSISVTAKSASLGSGISTAESTPSDTRATSKESAQDDMEEDDEALIELSQKVLRREPLQPKHYIEAVNFYGEALLPSMTDTRQRPHLQLAPRLTLSPEQEEQLYRRTEALAVPTEPEDVKNLSALRSLVRQQRGTVSAEHIWQLYASLEESGVQYLSTDDSQFMFSHLGLSEYREKSRYKEAMLRSFEQRYQSSNYLTRFQWTTAILLVGRSARIIQTRHVIDALTMWMRMEESSVPADATVFNVLIDIALRAEKFALADALIDELKARDLRQDRYLRLSMIYYAGMRHDGDAVRAAFNDFVNAGEVVDTSVMNSVIRSLLESGETEAAEHVFANMKELHEQKFPAEYPKIWQDRKKLQKLLHSLSREFDSNRQKSKSSFFGSNLAVKEKHEALQQMTPIHPDGTTYRTLIGHHALVSGRAESMFRLIEEMKTCGFQVTGSTYQKVFKGFQIWGDIPSLGWTANRLEKAWSDFVHDLPSHATVSSEGAASYDENNVGMFHNRSEDADHGSSVHHQPLHLARDMAEKIMRAFEQHCGSKRMERVWYEIVARWKTISPDEYQTLERLKNNLIRFGSKRDPQHGQSAPQS